MKLPGAHLRAFRPDPVWFYRSHNARQAGHGLPVLFNRNGLVHGMEVPDVPDFPWIFLQCAWLAGRSSRPRHVHRPVRRHKMRISRKPCVSFTGYRGVDDWPRRRSHTCTPRRPRHSLHLHAGQVHTRGRCGVFPSSTPRSEASQGAYHPGVLTGRCVRWRVPALSDTEGKPYHCQSDVPPKARVPIERYRGGMVCHLLL